MNSLTPNEQRNLERIVSEIPVEDGIALATQIEHTIVTKRSPTWVDLLVEEGPRPWSTGARVVPVTGHVDWDGRFETAVIVLVSSEGYLSAIEHYWYTDEPQRLPEADAMRLELRGFAI